MANTITKTVKHDGPRNYILDVRIEGDGTGEESATSLIDVSGTYGAPSDVKIEKIYWSLKGFDVHLLWDADTDTTAFVCSEGEGGVDFNTIGGPIKNTSGAGKTGDIKFTTVGLGTGDKGFLTIHCKKKY